MRQKYSLDELLVTIASHLIPSWPAQNDDFLAKLLPRRRRESGPEEIDSDDFIAERFSNGRK
jgi:hypothetical protein